MSPSIGQAFSLTHSAGVPSPPAAMARRPAWASTSRGGSRSIPGRARLFLHPSEEGDLLRLWTVKEALFKATPANDGAVFLDYAVDDPQALSGRASDRHGRAFEYLSRRRPEGWLTLAVSFSGGADAAA